MCLFSFPGLSDFVHGGDVVRNWRESLSRLDGISAYQVHAACERQEKQRRNFGHSRPLCQFSKGSSALPSHYLHLLLPSLRRRSVLVLVLLLLLLTATALFYPPLLLPLFLPLPQPLPLPLPLSLRPLIFRTSGLNPISKLKP